MILHCPQAEIQTTGVTSKAFPDLRRAHLSKFLLCAWRFCDLEMRAALQTKSFAENLGAERLYLPPLPHPACYLLGVPSAVNSAMVDLFLLQATVLSHCYHTASELLVYTSVFTTRW